MSGSIGNVTSNGEDIFVAVGGATITLTGAFGLENLNIVDPAGKQIEMGMFYGTDGNDSISNYFDGATINALGGNDSISNSGDYSTVDGGAGNDSIFNNATGVFIYGGEGNDVIENGDDYSYGDNATIDGGKGNRLRSSNKVHGWQRFYHRL